MSGNEYDFISFDEGVARIKQCLAALDIRGEQEQSVITSKNDHFAELRETLKITSVRLKIE